jgi:hypothetical protein
MSRKNRQRAERKQQRLNRLPGFAQGLITNRETAKGILALAPLARLDIALGAPVTPGFGLANFDACISIIKDALGITALSNEEFEYALRLSTPPEYREPLQ